VGVTFDSLGKLSCIIAVFGLEGEFPCFPCMLATTNAILLPACRTREASGRALEQ
jgi:hypothetical protein